MLDALVRCVVGIAVLMSFAVSFVFCLIVGLVVVLLFVVCSCFEFVLLLVGLLVC